MRNLILGFVLFPVGAVVYNRIREAYVYYCIGKHEVERQAEAQGYIASAVAHTEGVFRQ